MNNSCPSCGAVYNVAAKDVGRKIKCKKCSSALVVTDNGLEEEDGRGPASDPKPKSASVVDDDGGDDDDRPVVKKGKGNKFARSPGADPLAALAAVGGVPTVLFGFGVFLVIVFSAFPIIGIAATDRAAARVDELRLEQDTEIKELTKDKKELSAEKRKEIEEKYEKKGSDARLAAERTKIGNRRDVWYEMYGLMFGFLFTAFGCIGYLRSEQPLTLRIVAAVILGAMLLIMFSKFGGCAIPK